ncbi:MAG TPA: FAD-dependent oxidoreductase [Tepidisphaeraceae bacterium]|nr:FAD-dependent oxidoreductase [Tepidisphaeraceae bacterium]
MWGDRFWPGQSRNAELARTITADCRCDVLVVGAGVTGATLADALVAAGLDVIVVDKRQPGCGSTSASTALLLYELDTPLRRLSKMIGRERADRVYRMGVEAIARIEQLTADLADAGLVRFDR